MITVGAVVHDAFKLDCITVCTIQIQSTIQCQTISSNVWPEFQQKIHIITSMKAGLRTIALVLALSIYLTQCTDMIYMYMLHLFSNVLNFTFFDAKPGLIFQVSSSRARKRQSLNCVFVCHGFSFWHEPGDWKGLCHLTWMGKLKIFHVCILECEIFFIYGWIDRLCFLKKQLNLNREAPSDDRWRW